MKQQYLYFLGIAGQTMSGLAIAAKVAGFKVTGSDAAAYPPATDALQEAGIHYETTFDAARLSEDMTIILGNAITLDNPELKRAIALKLPILSYPQLVEQLTAKQHRIVVAGTHGKTTTSTLIARLLDEAGQRPDVILGMASSYFGGSVRLKGAKKVVIEGDEYSASHLDTASKFLYYHPQILVLTALDYDHPDLFKTYEDMVAVYRHLVEDLPKVAQIIAFGDDKRLMKLLQEFDRPVITYGLTDGCDYQAKEITYGKRETSFTVYHKGQRQERWTMQLAGDHNVCIALAAMIVAELEGVEAMQLASGLYGFTGVSRRFELMAEINDIKIIDDYAHNPDKVGATLKAARARYPEGKIWALFKPHTYSRTAALLPEFARALQLADFVLLSEVDAAREAGSEVTVRVSQLADLVNTDGSKPVHIVDNVDARHLLVENLQPGDTVVCMYVSGLKDVVQGVAADLRLKWE